jgi:CPA1 family monovalent cation:H+ antiporter
MAERLHVSPVLAIVAFGMIVSRKRPLEQTARDRIQTSAVWSAAVLVLNAVAFMLMGLQARDILARLGGGERWPAIGFALLVLATVLATRLIWIFAVRGVEGWIARRYRPGWLPAPTSWKGSLVLGWSGMRGLVTLAAAFAVPASVPGHDRIVLAAFTVVIGTLVIQGLTLGPLIRWLGVGEDDTLADKIGKARRTLIDAGLEALGTQDDDAARALRVRYGAAGHVAAHDDDPQAPSEFDRLHLDVLDRQRRRLNEMRARGDVAEDVYRRLLEELDWSEVEARSFADNRLSPS